MYLYHNTIFIQTHRSLKVMYKDFFTPDDYHKTWIWWNWNWHWQQDLTSHHLRLIVQYRNPLWKVYVNIQIMEKEWCIPFINNVFPFHLFEHWCIIIYIFWSCLNRYSCYLKWLNPTFVFNFRFPELSLPPQQESIRAT